MRNLNMATYKKWTESEIDFIKNNHASMPDEIIAAKLSEITNNAVTTAMVRRQRRKLQLKKSRGRPRKTTIVNQQVVSAS
jgi:hypothetical protein